MTERKRVPGVPHTDNDQIIPVWFPAVAFILGLLFIITILTLVVTIPNPSGAQLLVFRIVIALAGAAFAMALTGFVAIRLDFAATEYVVAGGSLAVFVILSFV